MVSQSWANRKLLRARSPDVGSRRAAKQRCRRKEPQKVALGTVLKRVFHSSGFLPGCPSTWRNPIIPSCQGVTSSKSRLFVQAVIEPTRREYKLEPVVSELRRLPRIRRRRGGRASMRQRRRELSSAYPRVVALPIAGLNLPDLRRQAYRRGS
jgi:hypothetical protein